MRLSAIAAVIAGAGIAQVAAVPIRVVIVSEGVNVNPVNGARFGHSVPLAPEVATLKLGEANRAIKPKHRCGGGRMSRFRQKGVEISNMFRQALGLPLIETHPKVLGHGGFIQIMPFPNDPTFIPEVNIGKWAPPKAEKYRTISVSNLPHPHHTHHHDGSSPNVPVPHMSHRPHHHIYNGHKPSFSTRLHHSLMHLGRWEGRAVAFVLGCGIGVLLRMFWVLAIVTFRAIKGPREDEHQYHHITIIEEYEDDSVVAVAPPTYVYPVDEKVAVDIDVKAPVTVEESK